MDYNRKKRRKTKSVQDMYGIGINARPSSRTTAGTRTMSHSNYSYNGGGSEKGNEFFLTIFGALLAVAIIVSCIVYFFTTNKEPFVYPLEVVTISGVLTDIYSTGTGEQLAEAGSITDPATAGATGSPITSVSAASAAVTSNYSEATSHQELLTQIDGALAAGDKAFITQKLLCKATAGDYIGYSAEAIDAFVTYMIANPEKRTTFIASVADANTYSTMTQDVYYLTLPEVKFVINIAYADTTVSISTFADTVVNGTDVLEQGPLLPMMYTFTVSNAAWANPSSQEIEVTLANPTIGINIGQ
jgi:hypothetical protein